MGKRPKIIILTSLTITLICIIFILFNENFSSPVPKTDLQIPSYIATPIPQASSFPVVIKAYAPVEISVGSPDGKLSLMMKEVVGRDSKTYTFYIVNLNDGSKREFFVKNVPLAVKISVPANTFSPNDKYVFLKEEAEGSITYPVFSIVEEDSGKKELSEISGLFKEKYPEYVITDVTGWGGYSLIVVNTDKFEGGIGPSFWYDVPGRSFIKLTTRFN